MKALELSARTRLLVLLVLLAVSFAFLFPTPQVQGDTSYTKTFKGLTSDVDLYADWYLNYTETWALVTGLAITTQQELNLGQAAHGLTLYIIDRVGLFFDTHAIPIGANITSATLSVYISSDDSVTDFDVIIQNRSSWQWQTNSSVPYGHGNDYSQSGFTGNGGTLNTATVLVNRYENLTLNSDGLQMLSPSGYTCLALRSSRDINGIMPTGLEDIGIASARRSGCEPILTVTFTISGYIYSIYGTYSETGSVLAVTTMIKVTKPNSPTETYYITSTTSPASLTVVSPSAPVILAWNISSLGNNKTRIIYTEAVSESIYLTIPDSTDNGVWLYTISVSDLAGMPNAYLSIETMLGDQMQIVERHIIPRFNSIPVYLTWGKPYTLRITCDFGTYIDSNFIMTTNPSYSLIITRDMFPTFDESLQLSVSAVRKNDTWVQANYTDSLSLTSWVYFNIQYKNVTSWVSVYSENVTASPATVLDWYGANNETNYIVSITNYRLGTSATWTYSAERIYGTVTSDVWAGSFEIFGTFPVTARYFLGTCILVGFFALFSEANIPLACFVGVIMAIFLNLIRFVNISWTLIGVAFMTAILVYIVEERRKEQL